jgi:DUF4097 and DUF4098 domain-containing protein YvlB
MDIDDPRTGWALEPGTTVDVAAVRRLVIGVGRGSVDVLGRDEPGARIEVRDVRGLPLDAHVEDGVLRIGAPDAPAAASAVLSVAVQRDAAVEVRVVSAEVLVSGVRQGLDVGSVSGDVVADATAGHARLETTSGELALRGHDGPVDVRTVSGPVTASGPVSRFECEAVSADLFLDLAAPDAVRLSTVSGAVVLRLGDARGATYAIDTVSGGAEVDGREVGRARGFRGSWGDVDGEPTRVRVGTASGTVRIVHPGAV